jgi:hypothetical protein
VFANVALSAFNKMYPPCVSLNDYVNDARKISSERVQSLSKSNITPRNPNSYGEQDVLVDDELLQQPKRGDINDIREGMTDGMNSNINGNLNESDYAVNFKDALKDVNDYKSSQNETKKTLGGYDGSNLAIFETELEGVQANVGFVNAYGARAPPSKFVGAIARDGYSERMAHMN